MRIEIASKMTCTSATTPGRGRVDMNPDAENQTTWPGRNSQAQSAASHDWVKCSKLQGSVSGQGKVILIIGKFHLPVG
jgi:hypothetical protein